jgi:uncharacterized protein (TIGR00730 family)
MRLCVFCGSSSGRDEVYAQAARDVGTTLAQAGIELVYGGGRVGLMGIIADAALAAGGSVIGVMPQALVDREVQHVNLTQLHVVPSMHERKTKMSTLADGFIALPGGAGTLEEIFEQWTWAQLGIHQKPCGFLNTNGYFDPLRQMIEQMSREGFLRMDHASMLVFDTNPQAIIDSFRAYSAPLAKWMATSQKTIRIVAALIQDDSGRVLLVRKKGTCAFMQPGGKLQDGESQIETLQRELVEELSCTMQPDPAYLGTFTAPAANEQGSHVEAAIYRVHLAGEIRAASEIEEILWLDPHESPNVELAPLTRDTVLRLAISAQGSYGRSRAEGKAPLENASQ